MKTCRQNQKEYRERLKKKGYKIVNVAVPPAVALLIKGNPGALVEAFIEANKENYIEMEFDGFEGDATALENVAVLRDKKGSKIEISELEELRKIMKAHRRENWNKRVRLYTNGTVGIETE